MNYFAHSENDKNEKHLLSEHLLETAKLMERFSYNRRYKKIFRLTGLLHDLGKYQPAFQNYLENGGRRGSVPHASWGAGFARILGLLEASLTIDGHHKGLPDRSHWKEDTDSFKNNEVEGFKEVIRILKKDINLDDNDIKSLNTYRASNPVERDVFVRYLFSALTDADWLDTEAHFQMGKREARRSLELPIDIMIEKLEKEIKSKPKEGEVNSLRNWARDKVLEKVELPPAFYSLALPTGIGKTLTSFAWALHHAKSNSLKRIVIVLPYINIIDQTAQILKNLFGQEMVLEHHSSYNEEAEKDTAEKGDYTSLDEKKKLACENWDYPVIITTTVQFFESMFSNRSSKSRKIHNLAKSVVIFDEVQTLPKEVLLPTLDMLKGMQKIMETSFLFCTATQPAFEKRREFDGIEGIIPLIDDPKRLYALTRRVEYKLLNELDGIQIEDLKTEVCKNNTSALAIFNTKKAALEFYETMKACDNWELKYHLSTSMCPKHRKNIIGNVREDLLNNKTILLVSTQLIEAGVDIDFPVVYRAMAPLEAVIQSAGRCNREGSLGELGGKTTLFNLEGSGMPDRTYGACAGYAEELIKDNLTRLNDHDFYSEYYAQIIKLYVDVDKHKIIFARDNLDFKTVNDSYRIIRNATKSLFIYNYSQESKTLFHSIQHKEYLSKADYRNMQPFVVQVYQPFINQNQVSCKRTKSGMLVWYGNYDEYTGISTAPAEADNLII
ncbi:MAG: CRISPR-associated helicase Cas3' [Syntrophaceae bacterium]|nr:CRISPR-associated helicase Cas3' [Syntrophaceae bacterium]